MGLRLTHFLLLSLCCRSVSVAAQEAVLKWEATNMVPPSTYIAEDQVIVVFGFL
jgi:hypothetical protein